MAEVGLVEVRLVGLSIPDFVEARQHSEELNREFALLVAQADASPGSVPDRLLSLTRQMQAEYADYTAALDDAVAAGQTTIDLTFRVPAAAAEAAAALAELLDETDRFCAGGALLTLATPARALHLRQWYLGEFVRQIAGEPPTPYAPDDLAWTT